MRILVCGGAGYIGSHMCKLLAEHGHEVGVLDDLSTGHRDAVRWGRLFHVSIGDQQMLEQIFASFKPQGVLHFAAKSLVGESGTNPALYYQNNVAASLALLECMRSRPDIPLVFSSTAAVYGKPQMSLISEMHPLSPINVYGRTKLMVERVLQDYFTAYRLSSVTFRYFNAAGADPSGLIGEDHQPETHLIPNILRSALGNRPKVSVFGADYDTPDGTCIRDYIHVVDLCKAHLLGLEYAQRNPGAQVFNLGSESGFSVIEVIRAACAVTGLNIPYELVGRREGDPERLVADSSLARATLGWQPQMKDLHTIIETAWKWHRHRHPRSTLTTHRDTIPHPSTGA